MASRTSADSGHAGALHRRMPARPPALGLAPRTSSTVGGSGPAPCNGRLSSATGAPWAGSSARRRRPIWNSLLRRRLLGPGHGLRGRQAPALLVLLEQPLEAPASSRANDPASSGSRAVGVAGNVLMAPVPPEAEPPAVRSSPASPPAPGAGSAGPGTRPARAPGRAAGRSAYGGGRSRGRSGR